MILALLITLSTQAAAAQTPTAFCTNGPAIALNAEICMFNDVFVQQGKACLTKFDDLSRQAATQMASSFTQDTTAEQSAEFGDSGADYSASLQTLDSLLAVNRVAIHEMEGYLANLIPPLDDSDVMDVPCYGDNHHAVSLVLQDFHTKLAQLENARAAASANGISSGKRENALAGSLNPAAAAKGGRGEGSAVPRGNSRAPASDITGTKPPQP